MSDEWGCVRLHNDTMELQIRYTTLRSAVAHLNPKPAEAGNSPKTHLAWVILQAALSLVSLTHAKNFFSAVCEILCQTVHSRSANCLRLNHVAGMLELKMCTAICVYMSIQLHGILTFWYKGDIPAN
jgi:hypothetical protein